MKRLASLRRGILLATALFIGSGLSVTAQQVNTSEGVLKVEKMVAGLDVPWGFAFVPGTSPNAVLITERDGRLLFAADGETHAVKGLPDIVTDGQGGLLDVMLPRDFLQSRKVFLTFSKRQGRGAGTAVAVGQLDGDHRRLGNVRVIFEATPSTSGGRHFGSRIVEARDGTLYVTLGERGDRPSAQDLSREQGSLVRMNRDGSIPADNPFVDDAAARPAIWSYGHRNPQGMAVDQSGQIWAVEHGAKGGDEINRIRKGANYGWPVISYGTHYSGAKIGSGTTQQGMEQPEWYWDPSIAPSGMMIYTGKLWPDWRGDFFVGSLKFDYISRLSGKKLREVEQLKSAETGRIRDVREAPDGTIWFASEYEGGLFRISPR